MTEPERPAETPQGAAGPTPEEISARLEALLKRTHAMRAQQAASPSAPGAMTWPPPDRELDHFDVVDVPDDTRLQAPAAAPVMAAAAAPAQTSDAALAPRPGAITSSFERPDWGELRLRGGHEDVPAGRGWLWALVVLLAAAALGEGAYIWHLHTTTLRPSAGQLRVDGPEGAEVRVNGRTIGPAPIEHALEPGDYDVEIVEGSGAAHAERVSVGLGRTVLLLPVTPATTTAATSGGPDSAPPSVTAPTATPASTTVPSRTITPGSASTAPAQTGPATPTAPRITPAATAGAVSATRGAVLIESTPSGLPVTMEGRERGVTPITIGQLRPGRHDVLVGGLARQVDVSPNVVTTLRVARP